VITRSSEAVVKNIHTHAALMSDHNPITFNIETKKPGSVKKTISYRKLKDIDQNLFKQDIQMSDLASYSSEDVGSLVKQYNSTLTNILDDHAPLITKQVTLRPNTPWYTEELQVAKQCRRKAERRWIATRLTIHLDILRAMRVRVNRLCQDAKSKYYHDKIARCNKDQKTLFKFTKVLLNKKNNRSLPTFKSEEILANSFADYFNNKIQVINQAFPPARITSTLQISDVPTITALSPVTEEELEKLIMAGNSKSCALDPIPTSLLKMHLDSLLPVLLRIVNQSLTTSTFPPSLKAAYLTPLLKKPSLDKDNFKHYRPVSNLPYIGKITERVVVQQLDKHKTENSLLEICQSAYRKFHSSETALLKVQSDILCAVDSKQYVLLLLLDFSSAFDTVDHEILIHRLESVFGITKGALTWMQSYLADRSFVVNINGTTSAPHALTTGLPQGSLIGPAEFPDYSSPLFTIARKYSIEIHMYADDTQLYLSFNVDDYEEAKARMEKCVSEMRSWLAENHLKLNEEKTEFLVIGRKNLVKKLPKSLEIIVGDATIVASQSARNIGAMFDCQLNMESQVNSITRSCYVHLRNIGRIRYNLTEEAAATLVHALISSKLDNLNSLLCGIPDYLIGKLQLIQNNAARIVTRRKKYEHITPLLKQLHWLPIVFRIKYKISLLIFKCLNGLAPQYLASMLTLYAPTRSLRSADQKLLKEKSAHLKTVGDRAFPVCAPKIWNALPESIRKCESLDQFKVDLKTHFFKLAFE
jgi:hypothetical protein